MSSLMAQWQMNGFSALVVFMLVIAVLVLAATTLYFYRKQHKQKFTVKHGASADPFEESVLLRTLIDHIPDFIYVKDTNSKFIVANQKLADTLGVRSPVNLIGKSDSDFYPKELANKYYWDEQEIIANGKSIINTEEEGRDEKNRTIYVLTTKIPVKDQHGKVTGIAGIGRDITERKKAEKNLIAQTEKLKQSNAELQESREEIHQQTEELNAQAESLQEANAELSKLSIAASKTNNVVIILNKDADFEWVNESFTRVYGYTLEEYIEENGSNLRQTSSNPKINEILDEINRTKKPVTYQNQCKMRTGLLWTQTNLSPILDKDGNIHKYVLIDADITALKKAEEEISRQTEEIARQRDELQKINKTKDKLFSIIAHDLRNPFHSIMGFTDLIAQNHGILDKEKMREYIGLINESAHGAFEILENLLQWARNQTGKISYEPAPFQINDLIQEIHSLYRSNLESKNIEFQHNSDDTAVIADRNMISTVLRNMVSNAIKFTRPGGKINVTAEKTDTDVKIMVADTGVGIKPEDQDKLFRVDKKLSRKGTGGEEGTGLGLVISKDFLKKHGAELSLESKTDKGTSFYFFLPAAES